MRIGEDSGAGGAPIPAGDVCHTYHQHTEVGLYRGRNAHSPEVSDQWLSELHGRNRPIHHVHLLLCIALHLPPRLLPAPVPPPGPGRGFEKVVPLLMVDHSDILRGMP